MAWYVMVWRRGCDQHMRVRLFQVSTWMGDRLWAGKPSRFVPSRLGQLSLPSLHGR